MAETTEGAGGGGAGARASGAGARASAVTGAIPPELRERAREGLELLRPHPHRGDLIAAGAVPLTVALLLINLRLDASWGSGIFFVVMALATVVVLGMGVLAPQEEERPRAYQVVLHLTGLILLFVTLMRLAQIFGVEEPLDAAWTAFLILGIVAGAAAWLARERRSAICALVAGISGTLSLLAFVAWAFSPDGSGTTRWILLLAALLLLAGALLLRDRHRRESVYLVDAAGVAIAIIGFTYVGALLFGGFVSFGEDGELVRASIAPGLLWKVVLLASGLGLVAYAGVDREAGPGYLGTLILLMFVVLVGAPGEGGPSLWFWPLVLLLIGAAMIVAGLRPRRELPPEPDRGAPAAVVAAPVAPAPAGPAGAAVEVPGAGSSGAPPVSSPPGSSSAGAPPSAPAPGRPAPPASPAAAAPAPPAAAKPPAEPPPPPWMVTPRDRPAGGAPAGEGEAAPPAPSAPDAPVPPSAGSAPFRAGDASPPSVDAPPPRADAPPPGAAPAPAPPAPPAPTPPTPEPAPEPSPSAPDAAPAPSREPEPPARGSLWARADPDEQPTKQHRVPPRDDT